MTTLHPLLQQGLVNSTILCVLRSDKEKTPRWVRNPRDLLGRKKEKGEPSDQVQGLTPVEGEKEGRKCGYESLRLQHSSKKGSARYSSQRNPTSPDVPGLAPLLRSVTDSSLQAVWPQCKHGDELRGDSSLRLSVIYAPCSTRYEPAHFHGCHIHTKQNVEHSTGAQLCSRH